MVLCIFCRLGIVVCISIVRFAVLQVERFILLVTSKNRLWLGETEARAHVRARGLWPF